MNETFVKPIEINPLPEGARIVGFGHRSGAESHMRCPRAYYLNYEYLGTGITPSPTPLYLRVGSAVHHGLADMLLGRGVDHAVEHAVSYLKDSGAYQLLKDEQREEQEVLVHGLLYSWWVYAHQSLMSQFEVLCVEQGAVEYVRSNEDEWAACAACMGTGLTTNTTPYETRHCPKCGGSGQVITNSAEYVALQSRPDALLRNRKTGEVAGWSWKTIDDPTDFRRSMLHNDLQGFMEMYYGERILEAMRGEPVTEEELRVAIERAFLNRENVLDILESIKHDLTEFEERARAARNIPTQVDYIQTVFLVKGKRKLLADDETPWLTSNGYDSDSPDEYGGYQPGKTYRQMSHLCYRYRNGEQTEQGQVELYKTGPNKGKPKPVDSARLAEDSWAYRFFKPGNETQSALSTKWLTTPIRPDNVRVWVDRLNAGAVYPSNMNDERNPHPIAKVIRFEEPLYRDPVKAAGHVQQQRERFVQIARNAQTMREEGMDNIQALDSLFPQHLISCRQPWRCAYWNFCHTPAEGQLNFHDVPEGFEIREPHHPKELELRGQGEESGL